MYMLNRRSTHTHTQTDSVWHQQQHEVAQFLPQFISHSHSGSEDFRVSLMFPLFRSIQYKLYTHTRTVVAALRFISNHPVDVTCTVFCGRTYTALLALAASTTEKTWIKVFYSKIFTYPIVSAYATLLRHPTKVYLAICGIINMLCKFCTIPNE